MSEVTVSPRSGNLPALNAAEALASELANINKRVSAPTGDRIRFSGKNFVCPDGSEGEELLAIVVDFVTVNLYYDTMFDKDNPKPPACFSISPEPGNMTPSPNSPDKQADFCNRCPQNEFGSALTGRGKACKNTRLLAVLPAASDENSPVWTMSIPPTSLKTFDAYVSNLAYKHRTLPVGVVTKITLDPNSTYAAPKFELVRTLSEEELAQVFSRRAEAVQRLSAEPDVSQYEPPKKKPAGKR